jgi:molecular chaperone DnaJ
MNYYLILGITSDASDEEIKEAYRRLAQKYHPDHYGEDSAPFLKIQEAYRVLTDPDRKRKYDKNEALKNRAGQNMTRRRPGIYPVEPEPLIPESKANRIEDISLSHSFDTYSPSFETLFDRLFMNFGFGVHKKSDHPENLQVEIAISRAQAESGGSMQLMVPVRVVCPLCEGARMIGFWDCERCGSMGFVDTELPLIITYPSGIQKSYTKSISLAQYGIYNFYLSLKIRVSENL